MASKYSIEAVFKLIDNITAPLDRVAGKGSAVGKALKNDFIQADKAVQEFGKKAAKAAEAAAKAALKTSAAFAAAGAAAATAFAVKGLKDAVDFEKGMARVGARANLTSEQLKGMSGDLLKLSNVTGTGVSTLTEAQLKIMETGISAADSVSFLETAVKAASGGFTDTTTAITGLSSVLKSYGMEANAASKISDQMMAAARAGGVSFEDMATKLEHVIPIASKFGVSSDRLFASVASMTSQGVPIADAAKKIKSALEKNGAAGLFNITNADAFNNALGQITNSAGATQQAFDRIDQTTGSKWGSLLNKVKNTGIRLGESLLPVFNKVIDKLSVFADRFAAMDFEPFVKKIENVVDKIFSLDFDKLTNGITQFFNVIDSVLNIVIKVGDILWDMRGIIIGVALAWGVYKSAQIGAVIVSSVMGLVKAVKMLASGTKLATVSQQIFNATALANPVGLIVTAIGILIGLFILAYQKCEPFRNIVNGLLEKLKSLGAHILQVLAPIFEVIKGVIEKVKNVFSEIAGTVGRVISIFGNLFNITGTVTGGFSFLDGALKFFSTSAQIAWTLIGGLVDNFGALFSGINDVIDAFSNGGFLAGIKQIGASLLRYLLTPIKTVLNAVSFLPGIGKLAKSAADKIGEFQDSLRYTKPEEIAPEGKTAAAPAKSAAPLKTVTLPKITQTAPSPVAPSLIPQTATSIAAPAPTVKQASLLNLRSPVPARAAQPVPASAASPWLAPASVTGGISAPIAPQGAVAAPAVSKPELTMTSPAEAVTRASTAPQTVQPVTMPVKYEFPEMVIPPEIIKTITLPVKWAYPPPQINQITPAGPVTNSVREGVTPPAPPMTQAEQIIYYENVKIEVSPKEGASARITKAPKSPNVELVISGEA